MNPDKYPNEESVLRFNEAGTAKVKRNNIRQNKSLHDARIDIKDGVEFKAYDGNTEPKSVYVLRSNEEHDHAGIWVKMFMCFGGNTVTVVEFENGSVTDEVNFSYDAAKGYWDNMVTDNNMHRDDSYIKDLDLGWIKI